jgi:hypothetical protein
LIFLYDLPQGTVRDSSMRSTLSLISLLWLQLRATISQSPDSPIRLLIASRAKLRRSLLSLLDSSSLPTDWEGFLHSSFPDYVIKRDEPQGVWMWIRKRFKYFSLSKRRNKDWQEVFRLGEVEDWDDDDENDGKNE